MPKQREKLKIEMVLAESAQPVNPVELAESFARCLQSDEVICYVDKIRAAVAAARCRTMPTDHGRNDDHDRAKREIQEQIGTLEKRLRELEAA